jgi:3-oxoacyl-[acyl-carrier-protein] synthase III
MREEGCGVGVVGLGAYLPAEIRYNDWWGADWRAQTASGRDDFIATAERSTWAARALERWGRDPFRGALERRVIAAEHESSDMEVAACRDALASAGRAPGEVDLVLGYSQVPDDAGPGNHGRVCGKLALPLETSAMTVDAGCASFVPQLTLATRTVQAGDSRCALLYQSSATSRVMDYAASWSPSMGDGAVAEVVAAVDEGLGLVRRVQLTRGELCDGLVLGRADGRGRWTEASSQGLVIRSNDPRAAARMGADGPLFAREACALVLERAGYAAGDVDQFVTAQASSWFGQACASAVGIPESRCVPVEDHFQRFGHLLAASVSLNLWVAWSEGRLRKGDLVLCYSPGVGFTQTATLLRWAMDPPSAAT